MGRWGAAGQGAAGGALAGSAFGPWGAAIGGVIGGGLGYLGGDPEDEQKKKMQGFYDSMNGQQSGPAHTGAYSDFRGNQQNLITQLEAMAQGRGPSLAAEQLKESTGRNANQQIGLAQSGAGNATAAAMGAQNNMARLGTQASQMAMQGRIQEQNNAIQNLGLNLHGARGQDEGMNQFNAHEQNLNDWGNRGAMTENDRLRLMAMQGMAPTGPNTGERILAGGASLGAFAAQQRAANRGANTQQPVTWQDPNFNPR
jgi:hypothetical protein